jgi:hypothetical protein
MPERCIICGRLIEIEPNEPKKDDWWDDDDDDFIPKPKKNPSSFCQFCQAKLRKEADDAVQGPKKPI